MRAVTDPVVRPRTCPCGKPVVGIIELGLTHWLDADPLGTAQVAVGILTGRTMFTVHRRPGTAVIDWLSPSPLLASKVAGFLAHGEVVYPQIVLVEHDPSHDPARGDVAAMPDWNIRAVPAVRDQGGF